MEAMEKALAGAEFIRTKASCKPMFDGCFVHKRNDVVLGFHLIRDVLKVVVSFGLLIGGEIGANAALLLFVFGIFVGAGGSSLGLRSLCLASEMAGCLIQATSTLGADAHFVLVHDVLLFFVCELELCASAMRMKSKTGFEKIHRQGGMLKTGSEMTQMTFEHKMSK